MARVRVRYVGHDLTLVNAQDGLQPDERPDQGGDVADSPAALEVFQRIDEEDEVVDARFRAEALRDGCEAGARRGELGRTQDLETETQ